MARQVASKRKASGWSAKRNWGFATQCRRFQREHAASDGAGCDYRSARSSPRGGPQTLRKCVPDAAQRAREPDERQTDQGCRIATLDTLEQRNPQRLCLEASGAIERCLALDVAVDLLGGEGPKTH